MYNENFLPAEASFPVQKISSESQVSLTSASKKRKYYVEDSMLYMTFDNTHFQTQLLAISLNDFQYKKTNFRQPIIREGNISRIEANSFLYKNQLFQIKSTFDYLIILIKDLDGKLLKEYKISKDEEISFKNSEIIQLGSDFGPTVRTINTNQFLRKVSNLNPGISCYELDGKNASYHWKRFRSAK